MSAATTNTDAATAPPKPAKPETPVNPSFLGFRMDGSEKAQLLREASDVGYAPSDVPLLRAMGILIKHKGRESYGLMFDAKNSRKSAEEIRQFFRWALGKERHPMPALVRKVLCVRRAHLQDGMASLKTADRLRTAEARLLAEIDRLLRDDGSREPETVCGLDGGATVTGVGSWIQPAVKPPLPPAAPSAPVDLAPLFAQLDDLQTRLTESDAQHAAAVGDLAAALAALGDRVSSIPDQDLMVRAIQTLVANLEAMKADLEATKGTSAETRALLQTLSDTVFPAINDLRRALGDAGVRANVGSQTPALPALINVGSQTTVPANVGSQTTPNDYNSNSNGNTNSVRSSNSTQTRLTLPALENVVKGANDGMCQSPELQTNAGLREGCLRTALQSLHAKDASAFGGHFNAVKFLNDNLGKLNEGSAKFYIASMKRNFNVGDLFNYGEDVRSDRDALNEAVAKDLLTLARRAEAASFPSGTSFRLTGPRGSTRRRRSKE